MLIWKKWYFLRLNLDNEEESCLLKYHLVLGILLGVISEQIEEIPNRVLRNLNRIPQIGQMCSKFKQQLQYKIFVNLLPFIIDINGGGPNSPDGCQAVGGYTAYWDFDTVSDTNDISGNNHNAIIYPRSSTAIIYPD